MATASGLKNHKKRTKSSTSQSIDIVRARVHNLKEVSVSIPRNKLVVVTGVSGSGKSSLTMDTLYAEGQRRYVESLSSYARQFLMRMNKPDVDAIKGLCPAIALEQKVSTRTTRSTVGSLTEVYDYFRLLFARIGKTYSPISGEIVKRDEVKDVVDYVLSLEEGTRLQLLVPLEDRYERGLKDDLDLLLQKGYARVLHKGEMIRIEDLLDDIKKKKPTYKNTQLLIDRFVVSREDEELAKRLADSIETAFFEGFGECRILEAAQKGVDRSFTNRFERDGMKFEIPNDHFFNYNNPYGACRRCEGFGTIIGIDHDLVIPDRSLSVYDGAIAPWKGIKMSTWNRKLINAAADFDFPIHRPIRELSEAEYELLWTGNKHFKGLDRFFKHLEEKSYKIQFRVMLSRYRGRTACSECKGTRLRGDASYVKIEGKSIMELLLAPISEVSEWVDQLQLDAYDQQIGGRILTEIQQRLGFMLDVGLGYLTLNRRSNTLSGGESQRINLTRTLGSNLTSSLYILDEPSVGLHPRDTHRLISVLERLRNLGNTVVVVEHEEDVMLSADHIIDIGPQAGVHGGEVVAAGTGQQLIKDKASLTGAYLSGREKIELPERRRKPSNHLLIKGARQFNLKDIDVSIPLNCLTVVSGVSGSGKTTLIKKVMVPALKHALEEYGEKPGDFDGLEGDLSAVEAIEMVDQNPIGKSSRSNPVTYVKAYDAIRELFSSQTASKVRGLKPKHFSFNVDGGRCDNCKGEGETVVEMQFLADVHLICEDCGGRRFKNEVLEVKYKGKHIHEVLELSIDEALDFFVDSKEVVKKLSPLAEVGLGYVKLGQSSNTLSGGEAQRVKLASFLGKGRTGLRTLFVFDEPTTGLHFHDIRKLLKALNALVERGHSVIVIEHNLEVIKSADWLIDLGPEGGKEGGFVVAEGTPEKVAKSKKGHTARFLKEKL